MTNRSLFAGAAAAVLFCASAAAFPSFTGVWESNFGRMHLEQQGDRVQGDYEHNAGHVDGSVDERTLEGLWVQADGEHRCREKRMDTHYWGHFRLVIDENGKVFHGYRASCDEALGTGGEWRGWRRDQ